MMGMAVVVGLLVIGFGSPVNAQAKKDSHLPSRTITYQIVTTSPTYRQAWTDALKQWGKLHVVRFVPTTETATVQLGTFTSKNKKNVFKTDQRTTYTQTGVFSTYKLDMNRRVIKKADTPKMANKAIGIFLGLQPTSKKANSILSPRKKAPAKPTRLDKQHLQKLYKNVAY